MLLLLYVDYKILINILWSGLKGLGHEIEFKYCEKIDTSICLNRNLYWFLNFKMSLCSAVLIAIFQEVNDRMGEIINFGDVFKIAV